jgi:hypothetical protein
VLYAVGKAYFKNDDRQIGVPGGAGAPLRASVALQKLKVEGDEQLKTGRPTFELQGSPMEALRKE